MRVCVLGARTFKSHGCTYPLAAFAPELRQAGFDVDTRHRFDPSVDDCDVLFVGSEFFRATRWHPDPPERLRFLEQRRRRVPLLIWLDMTDSTGTTVFEVLPFVDLYAKGQLLADRSGYTRELYGLRPYADYYHRTLQIDDGAKGLDRRTAAKRSDLDRLAVSWNLGLGDLGSYTKWGRRFRILRPRSRYRHRWTPPDAVRDVDVSFRGATRYPRKTVSFQREETQRRLERLGRAASFQVAEGGRLSYRAYLGELRRSAVAPSPFGLGEICFRDFECFRAGALLLKPDMEHLETWPAYFQPGRTYLPHRWDFADFEDRIAEALESRDTADEIAIRAQNLYRESLSEIGAAAFARHLGKLIAAAASPRREIARSERSAASHPAGSGATVNL